MKKQKDQTPELLQLKNRLKAIEAEVKSKDEEIEDLREQVEIVQNEKEWSNKKTFKIKIKDQNLKSLHNLCNIKISATLCNVKRYELAPKSYVHIYGSDRLF